MDSLLDYSPPHNNVVKNARSNSSGGRPGFRTSAYAYGGHSVYIPIVLVSDLEQTTFWDQQTIDDTVTRTYILEHIGGRGKAENTDLQQRLDTPVAFGGGLTESTYLEWILERARKIFLVLLELGSPEIIFQVVDNSWDDNDLPVDQETVVGLGLESPSLEKGFLKKQHMFLLRLLKGGEHVDYSEDETVALEAAGSKRQVNGQNSVGGILGLAFPEMVIDKVYFPRSPQELFTRVQVPLGGGGDNDGRSERETFLEAVNLSKAATHKHIVKIHASYTHQQHGYALLTPACDLNLSQFIKYPPYTFRSMPKQRRRRVLLEWLHCLANALAYMYDEGVAHRDIHPRSIAIDQGSNNILFASVGKFKGVSTENQSPTSDFEAYDYAAPELWQRAMTSQESTSPTTPMSSRGASYRRISPSAESSESPLPVATYARPKQIGDTNSTITPLQSSHVNGGAGCGFQVGLTHWIASTDNPGKSDIFSLGCIFLDILTLLLKKRLSEFIAHRRKNQRRPRQSAVSDQSFHSNLCRVETWIEKLEHETERKQDTTVTQILRLVRSMLERDPRARPHPYQVSHTLYKFLEAEFVVGDGGGDHPPKVASTISRTSGSIASMPLGQGEADGPRLHCEPTSKLRGSHLGTIPELELWPTSISQRTNHSSSSSGFSSAGSAMVMNLSGSEDLDSASVCENGMQAHLSKPNALSTRLEADDSRTSSTKKLSFGRLMGFLA